MLDVSRDFIYKVNLQTGAFEYVSPSVLPMYGFTPEKFAAMTFVGVYGRFHPDDQERIRPLVGKFRDNTLADDMLANLEYRWKRKDGEYRWLSDSSVLIRDAEGKPVAMVGAARDVTARKQAEEELRDLSRLRAMRNSIAVVFLAAPDEEMYADVLQVVLAITESKHGLFGYVDEDGDLNCPSMTRDIWDQCRMPEKNVVHSRGESWAGIGSGTEREEDMLLR